MISHSRFTDVVITNYTDGWDHRSLLQDRIALRCQSSTSGPPNSEAATEMILEAIFEECLQQEPLLPRHDEPGEYKRLLDSSGAFASEIANEVRRLS